jgi:hypothetical protein
MIYFLSHLTSFAQNFLVKGMIFAVFFGIAIGLIVLLVSCHDIHDITGFKMIDTDAVDRSTAYGLITMVTIMTAVLAFTMAAQEVGIKEAFFKKLDANYSGYTDVKYSKSDDKYTFKCKDQWYSCDFDYYNGEKLTVYKVDKTLDKTIE